MNEQQVNNFLSELTELCKKHKIVIGGSTFVCELPPEENDNTFQIESYSRKNQMYEFSWSD